MPKRLLSFTLVYGLRGTKQSRRLWQQPTTIFIALGWSCKGHVSLVSTPEASNSSLVASIRFRGFRRLEQLVGREGLKWVYHYSPLGFLLYCAFIVNLFYSQREQRPRAFWRLLCQLAIYAGAVIFLRLVAPKVWVVLYRLVVDPGAIENPSSPTSLFLAIQVALLLVAFFSVWSAGRLLDRRPLEGFGLHLDRQWWLDFCFGLFLGASLITVIFLVELAAGWVGITGVFVTLRQGASFFPLILAPLFGWVLLGIHEELVFRGYQLTNMAEGLNFECLGRRGAIVLAVVFSSSIFALFHVWNPSASVISTLNLALWGGLLLGVGYVLSGQLALSIGLHIAWNFFEGSVFGFPVSGWGVIGATVLVVRQGGPSLFTGGAFGPEAGLLTIAASVIGSSMILLWVRIRPGRAIL